MQEDLVIKLSDFGFTTNQAKVYLSIIESSSTSVAKIAQNTQLHVQDIYKILPKLEKMGLITRTLEKPVQIKAIPVDKALTRLLAKEKEEVEKRLSHLEGTLSNLMDSIKKTQLLSVANQDGCFVPLITAEQVRNQAELTFGGAISSCDLVVNIDLIKPLMSRLTQNIERFNQASVKVRLIVETLLPLEEAQAALQKALPKNANITAKYINKTKPMPYYVVDNKEVWISMEKETEVGLPRVLWTNGKNIVEFFHESFNDAWNKSSAVNIPLPNTMSGLLKVIVP
jgi:sugar-specific transcriptional regulator TrmB